MGRISSTTKMDTVEAAPSISLTIPSAGSTSFLTLTIKSTSPIATPTPSQTYNTYSVKSKVMPICVPYASVTPCVRH